MATLTRAPLGTLRPGKLSPRRHVPAGIERPEYIGHDSAQEPMPGEHRVKDADTIARIAHASRIAADTLVAIADVIAPGVTTDEIDRVGHEYMVSQGSYPSTLGYLGYPKSLCTSVNEVICHGIPDDTPLQDGDIVNVDVTAFVDGVHGDTNYTFLVGDVDDESRQLVARTYEAMMRGIRAVKPGRRIPVIGRVIESYAKRFDYGVVRDFTGHGVGESFHSGLVVPHYDSAPQYDVLIEEGMVFTIEPMLTLGDIAWEMWDNGWTVVTKDRTRSAQFEHTLVVRADGAEILTLPTGTPMTPVA